MLVGRRDRRRATAPTTTTSGGCRSRTTAAVREAVPRGLPGRAVVADDPAQARGVPPGVRRLRLRPRSRGSARATSSGCSATRRSSGTAARSSRRSTTRARALELVERAGSLAAYVWRFEPAASARPGRMTREALRDADPTPESRALAKDLKRRGWTFVGPTTVYAFMQAMGLVDDHLDGCAARRGSRPRGLPSRVP